MKEETVTSVSIKRDLNRRRRLSRTKWFMAVTAFLVVLLAASGFLYMENNKPFVLLVDEEPLAIVTGEGQVKEVIDRFKNDLGEKYGIAVTGYNNQLSYSRETLEDSDKPIDDTALKALLDEKLDWQIECWTIHINDKTNLSFRSEQDANAALEGIKQYYLPADSTELTIENIYFNESIRIEKETGPVKQLKTPEEAVTAMAKGLDKIIQHNVKSGDSLWLIAHANNLTVNQLLEINPQLKSDLLHPGQQINLVKSEPLLTVTSVVVATKEEGIPYNTVYENDSGMWRGQQKVKQNGVYGKKEVTYRITKDNDNETNRETLVEKILLEPVSRIVIRGTKMMVASRGDGGNGQLGWPLRGSLTSLYGKRGRETHTGLDINGDTGDPVFAAEKGVVFFAGRQGGYGNMVTLDHGNGLSTRYGHLSSIKVSMGQQVDRGDIIGLVGSTGRSTGSHLHFEVRVNGYHKNPLNFLGR